MKSMVGLGMVAVAASLSLMSCGDGSASESTSPVIQVGATNFVTIPPEPATTPPITTAPDAPGSILQYDGEYTVQEGDYPSTVAAMWKVPDFQAFLDLNGLTIDENQMVPEWPPPGTKIKIPAGSTVPGEPPPSAGTTVAPGGSGDTQPEGTEAPAKTDPPEKTEPPTTESDCTPGSYTIAEGDYPGLVAKKFDVTVGALNAANQSTKYYSSFIAGTKIVIPC